MGLFDSLFGSDTETTSSQEPFRKNPWKPQQPFIKKGFQRADDAFKYAIDGMPKDFTTSFNDVQKGALGQIARDGSNFADSLGSIGGQARRAFSFDPINNRRLDQFGQNANQFTGRSGVDDRIQNVRQDINQSDYDGHAQGIYRNVQNTDFGADAGVLYGDVNSDQTSRNIGNAGQYASNPFLDGQIDAAIKDVNRGFQIERGNINSQATGSGNINSTRAGTMEAYARKDAMDRAAAISTGMRSDAYNTGVNAALQSENLRQGSSLQANQQQMQGILNKTSAKLDTNEQLMQGVETQNSQKLQGLNPMIDRMGQRINANQQLGTAAGMKEDAVNNAYGRAGDAAGILYGAYDQRQTGNADVLSAGDRAQQQQRDNLSQQLLQAGYPMSVVQQYMQSIGGDFGSRGYFTSTSTSESPSPFQQIVGGAASIIGAGQGF